MTIDNRHASGETALRIIEALPNILIAVDRQTHIQYINRAPAGVALESALGRSVTDYVAEVDREAVCAVIQGVFATAGLILTRWRYTARVVRLRRMQPV